MTIYHFLAALKTKAIQKKKDEKKTLSNNESSTFWDSRHENGLKELVKTEHTKGPDTIARKQAKK